MKISELFHLDRTQSTLDFVDVDTRRDTKLFVDPRALRLLDTDWGHLCVFLIQNYFSTVLNSIRTGNHERAKRLLRVLKEPNETHLGLSRGDSHGRALGNISSVNVWEALSRSEAVLTGLIEDLEDTILMVPGISSDIISDISTNIIREPLIEYTKQTCLIYGIPLEKSVNSGPLWNPDQKEWYSDFVQLPRTDYGKLMLIPKAIVRKRLDYDEDEYYRDYILDYLYEAELSANTELVRLLKDGTPRVWKKDLKTKYGSGKKMMVKTTQEHPEILEQYRIFKRDHYQPPLDHYEMGDDVSIDIPDWDSLLQNVLSIPVGRENSGEYEIAIEKLLSALFYPCLTNPRPQHEIHNRRKRIDITYTNTATYGFFSWLIANYNAPYVYVECKNYSNDLENPELDQLSGRFSTIRGRFGILACRSFSNKELFEMRCHDTANDGRGFIIVLDDNDLKLLVEGRKNHLYHYDYSVLKEKFDRLVS